MVYYARTSSGDHFEHHGILGMKWGIRRFQNEDGSLTDEGKRRYYADSAKGSLSSHGLKRHYQVMTNPENGQSIKSYKFTDEQLSKAREKGYQVQNVVEEDRDGRETVSDHKKKVAAIGATVVAGIFAAKLLIKKFRKDSIRSRSSKDFIYDAVLKGKKSGMSPAEVIQATKDAILKLKGSP